MPIATFRARASRVRARAALAALVPLFLAACGGGSSSPPPPPPSNGPRAAPLQSSSSARAAPISAGEVSAWISQVGTASR